DTYNHTIRIVTVEGTVTLAGSAELIGSTDGTGSAARFDYPSGVAVDASRNVYVADTYNHTIRMVTSAGEVTTLAGSAGNSGSADGTGSAARFDSPMGVSVDSDGNVYVADKNNHTIRKVTSAGVVTTLAGSATNSGSTDGTGSAARFYFPMGVSVDSNRNVYVADTDNHTIRKGIPSVGTLQFSASSTSVNENAGSVTLTVTRTNGSSGAASVNYATSNGTASAGTDYTATSGTINWADGNSDSKTITILISDDSVVDGDKTFTVALSSPSGASLGTPYSATVTITDSTAPPPSAPTDVRASDGTYTDKVQVIWNAVADASSYEVWRNTVNDFGSAGKLADVAQSLTAEERESLTLRDTENQPVLAPRATSPAYDDTSALVAVTYYYWVKAKNAAGTSDFSGSDSGYRKAGLPPPASVVASDGTYSNKVRIVWPIVTGATRYEVWRATVNAVGFAALLGEVSELEGYDTTARSGTLYYYWVKSKNALETSGFRLSDSGYRDGKVHIQPEVTINGASGHVSLYRGDTLSFKIFLMATSDLNADWWVMAAFPGGAWYYYDAYTGEWNPIAGEFTPTYQGALFDFLAPIEILNISTTWLPVGTYVFYFAVDTTMNGYLDLPLNLVYDSVTLKLAE
ncbi:MAG: hypothetical protein L6437_16570, partial [Kiritimatiellae bacterium]|nr:hypothetical protein [Kiritimatiellia bacterium]